MGGHLYIAQRLVFDPGLAGPARALALGAIGFGFACLLLQPFAERLVRPPWNRWIGWPASIWMGVAFLFLVVLGAGDALRWIAGGVAYAAGNELPSFESVGARAGRGRGARGRVSRAPCALFEALRPPRLVRLEIALARWPRALDGFRIAQISDIHIGPLRDRRFSRHLTERVNALAPDLIAVTGDLVDGSARLLADEVAPFGELRARHGAFFVTGNHDHYSGADAWVGVVERLGLVPLRNRTSRSGATAQRSRSPASTITAAASATASARTWRARSPGAIPGCPCCCSRTTRAPSSARRRAASTCSSRVTRTAGRSGRSATWCASQCRSSRAVTRAATRSST